VNWAAKGEGPPSGYAYGPAYRPSLLSIALGTLYVAFGRPRSLGRDSLHAVADMPQPPLIRGVDRIPESGRLVVVANHYERPGLWMAWPALALAQLLWQRTGRDMHFVAIETWETMTVLGIDIPRDVIRRVFKRAFSVYGIFAMPSPDSSAAARAASMRAAVAAIKEERIIGLMPEGTVGLTPELLEAREGAGTFLQLLAAAGARLLPVGIYEEHGRLVLEAGDPFVLHAERGTSREQADRAARRTVMLTIRDLLPPALWGVYNVKEGAAEAAPSDKA
jgi:1-acyl-sn-glycerol-3-phosphate acyltransferase